MKSTWAAATDASLVGSLSVRSQFRTLGGRTAFTLHKSVRVRGPLSGLTKDFRRDERYAAFELKNWGAAVPCVNQYDVLVLDVEQVAADESAATCFDIRSVRIVTPGGEAPAPPAPPLLRFVCVGTNAVDPAELDELLDFMLVLEVTEAALAASVTPGR